MCAEKGDRLYIYIYIINNSLQLPVKIPKPSDSSIYSSKGKYRERRGGGHIINVRLILYTRTV